MLDAREMAVNKAGSLILWSVHFSGQRYKRHNFWLVINAFESNKGLGRQAVFDSVVGITFVKRYEVKPE